MKFDSVTFSIFNANCLVNFAGVTFWNDFDQFELSLNYFINHIQVKYYYKLDFQSFIIIFLFDEIFLNKRFIKLFCEKTMTIYYYLFQIIITLKPLNYNILQHWSLFTLSQKRFQILCIIIIMQENFSDLLNAFLIQNFIWIDD